MLATDAKIYVAFVAEVGGANQFHYSGLLQIFWYMTNLYCDQGAINVGSLHSHTPGTPHPAHSGTPSHPHTLTDPCSIILSSLQLLSQAAVFLSNLQCAKVWQ